MTSISVVVAFGYGLTCIEPIHALSTNRGRLANVTVEVEIGMTHIVDGEVSLNRVCS